MKNLFLSLTGIFLLNAGVWAQKDNSSVEAKKTYEDISQTLGSIPSFLKNYPQEGISGAWSDMKNLQLNPDTSIPVKYKELMGLAVSAQIPCSYCVYFHTQTALLHGASQQEIKEAVAMAASTRRWSTFLNGTQVDEMGFKNEVNKMLDTARQNKNKQAMEVKPAVLELKTADDAYKDIQATIGFVPDFLKNYPKQGVVGVWKDIKGVEMNPATEIPPKYKQLIGLAVAAQVPCDYCTFYHSQVAISENATKEELQEASAIAGITRQWSTVINGHAPDEKVFKGEVDQVIKFLKNKSTKKVSVKK